MYDELDNCQISVRISLNHDAADDVDESFRFLWCFLLLSIDDREGKLSRSKMLVHELHLA